MRSPEPQESHLRTGTETTSAALLPFARRYVWWKTATEAAAQPNQLIAQVMNMGDHRDVEALARLVGNAVCNAVLRDVLQHAEAGQFGERAWTCWHYRLGLADVGRVPPLPTRRFS